MPSHVWRDCCIRIRVILHLVELRSARENIPTATMKGNVLAALLVLLVSSALAGFDAKKQKKHGRFDPNAGQAISNSINKMSLSLYKTLASNHTDINMIISPLSIQVALALTYLGTNGQTAKQMSAGLHLPADHNTVKAGFRQMLHAVKSAEAVELEIANRIYLQSNFTILKEFRRTARKSFRSDVKDVNFAKNHEKARKIINNWVEKVTRQKIKQVIGPGVLNTLTRLVIVNAVYFKAGWMQPFNSDDTDTQAFHVSSTEEIQVPMMHIKAFFGSKDVPEMKAKILELPYKSELASMYILLPNEQNGISELEASLSTVNLADIFKNMTVEEFQVALPKFKAEESHDLKSALKELGLKDMFDSESADLSGITGSTNIFISDVLQKAFVEVTELGTEAGASTAVVAESRSWKPPPTQFTVNHPFIFVIWHKSINTVLFMGKITRPE